MLSQRARGLAILLCWLLTTCVWWSVLPRLLGLSLRHPVPTLIAALLAPPLLLSVGLRALDELELNPPSFNETVLGSSFFAALLVAAFLSPVPVIALALDIDVASSLTLVFLADIGAVLAGCAVLALWLALPLRDLSRGFDCIERAAQAYNRV